MAKLFYREVVELLRSRNIPEIVGRVAAGSESATKREKVG